MPFAPTPKNPGDLIRSQDWNDAMAEVVRLDSAKLNLTGGTVNGPLSVQSLNIVNEATNQVNALQVNQQRSDRAAAVFQLNGKNAAWLTYTNLEAADTIWRLFKGGVATIELNTNGNTYFNGGRVGIGTATPGGKLEIVNEASNQANALQVDQQRSDRAAAVFRFNGKEAAWLTCTTLAAADTIWRLFKGGAPTPTIELNTNGNTFFNGGKVGIGTAAPSGKLEIVNEASNQANALQVDQQRSDRAAAVFRFNGKEAAWLTCTTLAAADTIWRLFKGGAPTIELNTNGNTYFNGGKVGIGTNVPGFGLDVVDRIRLRKGTATSAGLWLHQTDADRAFVGLMDDNTVGLWGNTGASPNWGLKMNTGTLDVTLEGSLHLRKTGDGYARFTHEPAFPPGWPALEPVNNLRLVMANVGSFSSPQPWLFTIGATGPNPWLGGATSFAAYLSLNQKGDLTISGALSAGDGKGGFVVDNFINAVGEALEQGDVLVVGGKQTSYYYGAANKIPVPEVDLASQAYDTRVCGIVDTVVRADSLPPYEQVPTEEEVKAAQAEKTPKRRKVAAEALAGRLSHPFAELAAPVSADLNTTQVQAGQLGKMVTLGAYAWCKVDADIAAIAVGDLLTTSPTRGHAQKVIEPGRAVGAILGKALGALKKGKGKIPVLVVLQ